MELLTAVNLILPKLGEHTVTSTSAKHPTLGIILPNIELKLTKLLEHGWWFNTADTVTLYQDTQGKIARPVDLLSLETVDGPVAMRSDYLWNTVTGTDVFTRPITGRGIYRMEFKDLPETAARVVLYEGCVESYLTDIGKESIVAEWRLEAEVAMRDLKAHHLRQKRYSTQKSNRFLRIRSAMWS